MRDILVIVPTRGRPNSAKRLMDAMGKTCQLKTDVIFAVDDDDPSYGEVAHSELAKDSSADWLHGPRATCGQWTNQIASAYGSSYRALASFGDDHVPLTPGWDAAMMAAIDDMHGTGFTYGDDMAQHGNLPTAPVMSSNIVAALGWMFYPPLIHFFADNVWLDLGKEANCLRYMPEVVIQHLHYTTGRSERDQTYTDAEPGWDRDYTQYRMWKAGRRSLDADKIRHLQED